MRPFLDLGGENFFGDEQERRGFVIRSRDGLGFPGKEDKAKG
jgi:hypothetical protein